MEKVQVIPLKAPPKSGPFSFVRELSSLLESNGEALSDGDVLVVSSKYLAMSEGRYVRLKDVVPLGDADSLASEHGMNRAFVEAVLRESDFVLKGLQGFLLTIKDGFFAPNAGVDKSNIPKGCVILHPSDSMAMAARIRREVLLSMGAKVAVVITDSRLQPLRKGTVGVSVGFSGIEAVVDDRGRADLFGNLLKVTRRAIADNISSAVQLVMGESDEGVPVAIVRGLAHFVADIDGYDSSVEPEECIFVRGLSSYSSATA